MTKLFEAWFNHVTEMILNGLYQVVKKNLIQGVAGILKLTCVVFFNVQIELGDFTEALNLAENYNLDTDRVYQSQWRKGPVNEKTISSYLVSQILHRLVLGDLSLVCVIKIPRGHLSKNGYEACPLKMCKYQSLGVREH